MFAVIKTGGKQYSVQPNDRIRIEKIAGEPGDMIDMTEVLMIGETIGAPLVDGAVVTAEIIDQGRARKVIAFKKRRRQNSRRKIGHRQHFTLIEISEILGKGEKATKKGGSAKIEAEKRAARAERMGGGNNGSGSAGDTLVARMAAQAAAAGSTISDAVTETVEKATKPKKDEAKKADDKPAAKAPAEPKAKAKAKAEPEAEAKDLPPLDGPLFTAPKDGAKDKLTDIKGIGPVAEKQLNEQGITTFAQIAALSDDDIQRVDDYMPFSSAQIRDWQGQAKDRA
ncbi:50S ribosomal protein L21 [Rhizobiaceae bacterium]|nr:50S ribosomal protein L21 [Rhizobiaceae bacterium]